MLLPFTDWLAAKEITPDWMVCAFGPGESACLKAAYAVGGKRRVGFENSLWHSDGQLARDNAERALAMLQGAGVDGAKLVDGISAGRSVWRVHVGPVAPAMVAELSARFAGLGFGQPQVVRD